jgi:hypothetical protein
MFDEFDLSDYERSIFDYHTYDNVSDEDKVLINAVFEDICNDNKDGDRYDFESIEDEIIDYSISSLSRGEDKYLRDMFDNFKKGVN